LLSGCVKRQKFGIQEFVYFKPVEPFETRRDVRGFRGFNKQKQENFDDLIENLKDCNTMNYSK